MPTTSDLGIMALVFLVVTGVVLVTSLFTRKTNRQALRRLEELSGRGDAAKPKAARDVFRRLLTWLFGRMASDPEGKGQIQTRLVTAGFYDPNTIIYYYFWQLFPTGVVFLGSAACVWIGLIPNTGMLFGCIGALVTYVAPGMVLDSFKKGRQRQFRKALPDALDVIVICLEGGLSLQGAMRRIVNELWSVHPLLSDEMAIAEREILLGRTTGEALYEFAHRSDLEEVRSLASLVTQAETFGTSMVKALGVYADSLRIKRQQEAEEIAQKAATKIMFPTLLFIFPALFVVILGPAVIQLMDLMASQSATN